MAPDRLLHAARTPLAANDNVPTGVDRIGGAGPAGVHGAGGAAVAVIDTGIDLSHPDLDARPGINCVSPSAGPPQDDDGHGTFVAGVIGARNDGAGIVGVAPGTALYAVKALSANGAGYIDDIICGIDWVTANAPGLGIRVANMSLSQGRAVRASAPGDPAFGRQPGSCSPLLRKRTTPTDIANEIPGLLPRGPHGDRDVRHRRGTRWGRSGSATSMNRRHYATFSNFATSPAEIAHLVAAPGRLHRVDECGAEARRFRAAPAPRPRMSPASLLCASVRPAWPGPCADMTPAEVIAQIRADAVANATPPNGFVGDPFHPHPLGHYFGHLVSAADPAIRRIPLRPAPVVTAHAMATADTTLEVLALRIARRQRVDNLRVVVRLAEAGTVTARARVRLRGGAARLIASRRVTVQAEANRTYRLRLSLPRTAVHRIKRALQGGARVRAKVNTTVSDAAGNSRSKSRRVRLRR